MSEDAPRRNIEVKARVMDGEALRRAAHALPARDAGMMRQVDTYFHVPRGRLKRRVIDGERAELIAYDRPDRGEAKRSDYRIAPVVDADAVLAVLGAALGVRVRVEKERRLLLHHHTRIHLDRVTGLGEFVELETVLVPAAAGVLSALGLVTSDERRDRVVSHVRPLTEVGDLPAEGEADLRYAGQSFELTVPLGGDLGESFHRAHEERYGYAERDREVELVAVRTADVRPGPDVALPPAEPWHAAGPAVVELEGATCWIPPGWVGVRDGSNSTLRLTRT